jgi:hypothetical protein
MGLNTGLKRSLVAAGAAALLFGGAAAGGAAQSDQSAATVSHECVDGTGHGTVTVNGEVKSTQTVPNERSEGRGPCQPPPGQTR